MDSGLLQLRSDRSRLWWRRSWPGRRSHRRAAVGPARSRRTVIINVQGEISPFLDPAVLDRAMAEASSATTPSPSVLTPVVPDGARMCTTGIVVENPCCSSGRALYFSRSAIPHVRGIEPSRLAPARPLLGHVGIYALFGRCSGALGWPARLAAGADRELGSCVWIEAGIPVGTFPVERRFPLGGHRRAAGSRPGPCHSARRWAEAPPQPIMQPATGHHHSLLP